MAFVVNTSGYEKIKKMHGKLFFYFLFFWKGGGGVGAINVEVSLLSSF